MNLKLIAYYRSGRRVVAASPQRTVSARRLVCRDGHLLDLGVEPQPEHVPQPRLGRHVLHLRYLRPATHQAPGGSGGWDRPVSGSRVLHPLLAGLTTCPY